MPAIAHQNKILGNTSGGGSTILVTTSESTLYGQTVTLSDGTTTLTGTFSNAGECEFTGVMMVGTLTATSGTASTSINVPYFGVYSIILSLFSATITATYSGGTCTCVGNGESYTASSSPYTFTVHGAATYTITNTIDGVSKTDTVTITTDGQSESVTISFGTINVTYDNDFRGTSITCTQGGTTITKTAPSGTNTMTFYPPTTGNWVISGTVSGTSYSKTANVTSLSTSVSVSLETVPDGKTTTPTDDIEKWLQCGQITGKSYTTLAEVLADAETYERLLSDSNACDYMARSTTWASTICADSDAMMRLGKYDYACDALLADSTWCTAICGSTYFEYVLDVKVPTMTSNTTPSGTCIENAHYAGYEAYFAFDNEVNSFWWPASGATNNYIGYIFTSPIAIKYLTLIADNSGTSSAKTIKVQASNDGFVSDINDVGTIEFSASSTTEIKSLAITNDVKYTGWRLFCSEVLFTTGSSGKYFKTIQFYGRHTAQTDIIVTAHGGDTVYYMENGSPVTLTTADSDTGIGTVDWSDLPKGAITLYSSTAKNPSDLTADYSKTVYVTEYTTQIYLMPDKVLYWYGFKSSDLEDNFGGAGAGSYNTSNVVLSVGGIGTNTTRTGLSAVKAICTALSSGTYAFLGRNTSKSATSTNATRITDTGLITLDLTGVTGDYYLYVYTYSGTSATISALFTE